MRTIRKLVPLVAAALLACAPWPAHTQEFPARPIRIVTGNVGAGSDIVSRMVAQALTPAIGQQVIVENRPSGVIPGQTVARATPDGYTVLLAGSGFWLGKFLGEVPYDPVKDFVALTLVSRAPHILVVHASVPAKSVKELIGLAKARPGELNYGTGSTGSAPHLAAELFKAMAGVNLVRVRYNSGSLLLNDLLAGRVQVLFVISATITPHLKAGKLNALAISSAQPSPLVPGLPTIASSGVPGYEADQILAMFAPAKTPAVTLRQLNHLIARTLNQPDVKEKFFNAGLQSVGSTPEELAAVVRSEMLHLGKVIKDAGIRGE